MTDDVATEQSAAFLLDAERIQKYLAFGFVPTYPDEPLTLLADWSRRPKLRADEVDVGDLVRAGVTALHSAIEQCAERGPGTGQQVVLLSGGLDSRAILGGLLEHFDRSEVVAATFGMPGERDYDFAAAVAAAAGVRHERLETASVEWTTEGLVGSVLARHLPLPFPFGQRYLSYLLHTRLGRENTFWDGLCGDAVSGDWAPAEDEVWDWPSAVEDFLKVHLLPGTAPLLPDTFDPAADIPTEPFHPAELLTFPEQLDHGVRQRCYTGTRRLRDYRINTPFLTGAWLDFMLSAPPRYRYDQHLYKEVLKAAFPRLFSLPTTLHGGPLVESGASRLARGARARVRKTADRLRLPTGAARPDANARIRSAYRRPGPIQDLVRANLTDLAGRDLVDETALRSALAGYGPHADSLVTITLGLELNLKAAERQARAEPGPRP
ncbi:asparagine synthase-related protein [Georgenia thermotolerans]|nr:asparagine synthase-related protein [Georgenia thermotolerans]